jgi:hypothetical protein
MGTDNRSLLMQFTYGHCIVATRSSKTVLPIRKRTTKRTKSDVRPSDTSNSWTNLATALFESVRYSAVADWNADVDDEAQKTCQEFYAVSNNFNELKYGLSTQSTNLELLVFRCIWLLLVPFFGFALHFCIAGPKKNAVSIH